MTRSTEHHETVIVGGGQAGLATGYHLQRRGREVRRSSTRDERVGDAWRRRWALAAPLLPRARCDGLPGMPFPGPARDCPTARARWPSTSRRTRSGTRCRSGSACGSTGVERNGDGYLVVAGDDAIGADNVVVATGIIQELCPASRSSRRDLDPRITQIHSARLPRSGQLARRSGARRRGGALGQATSPTSSPAPGCRRRSTGQGHRRAAGAARRPARCGRWRRSRAVRADTASSRSRSPIGRKAAGKMRSTGGPACIRIRGATWRRQASRGSSSGRSARSNGKPVLADGGSGWSVETVVWCTASGGRRLAPLPHGPRRGRLPAAGAGHRDRGCPASTSSGCSFLHSFSVDARRSAPGRTESGSRSRSRAEARRPSGDADARRGGRGEVAA